MKTSSTFSLFLTAFLFSIVGCATQDEASSATDSATVLSSAVEDSEFSETQPSSEIEDDLYNDYLETGGHVALIVGVGEVMDNGYNEAALSGAKTYTQALFSLHKKSKTTPEKGSEDSSEPLSHILGETADEAYPTISYEYEGKTYYFNGQAIMGYDNLLLI